MHLLTQSALLKALGWSLFNSLWQMSLLWAIYHLFILIFHESSARTRHGLAVILLTAGAAWTALTFITTYWFGPATDTWLLTAPLQSYENRLLSAGRRFIDEGLSWCSFLYLLVLGGLLIQYAGHYLRSRRLTRAGLSKIAPGYRVFVAATARNMGILPAVKVHLSSLVNVPVTLGFLKPVILLPLAMITHLTPQQVEAVLVHELAHIRRRDYLINLGITAMELLFFFNPFARMLIDQVKKEREHCCDDLVLQFRYDPHAYVSALLSLARQHRQGRLEVAATGSGSNQLLLQRARKILQQKRQDERPGFRSLFLLLLTILMTTMLSGLNRSPHPARPVVATVARPAVITASVYTAADPTPAEGFGKPIANSVAIDTKAHRTAAIVSRPASIPHKTGTYKITPDTRAENEGYWFKTAERGKITAPAYADLVVIDQRDYSIGEPANDQKTPSRAPATDGYPFVPQSSFSFQYTDTLPPEDRLAMLQLVTEKSIRDQMGKLESELQERLDMLKKERSTLNKAAAGETNAATLAPGAQPISQKRLKQLLRDQLQLQQQYLIRMDSLERQLQQALRRLTTVYI